MNTASSFDEADARFRAVLFALCKNVDSPHSLAVWMCFKHDHTALADLEIRPENYGDSALARLRLTSPDPNAFALDLGCSEIVSKYKGLKLNVNTKDEALRGFAAAELRMSAVNKRLKCYLTSPASPRLEAIIHVARRQISKVLGPLASSNVVGGWGPGSTFSLKEDVGWDNKILETRISVTASALPFAARLIGADIHWCRARGLPADAQCTLLPSEFQVVQGNRISTVSKNAKTDRTIAIEPTANIFLQKSAGSWIRRRLRKIAGINLDSQARNQRAARVLRNATIDLKSASDSISIQLVKLLLPEEWADWLGALRSEFYKLGSRWTRYEKWSSMGNGYTFELETLLFWAIASAVQLIDTDRYQALVYGDDIIVPVDYAQATIDTLIEFGFETNVKKTHFKSLYRESCGAHYFNGRLITPVYQKELLNHVGELYNMANRLRHFAARLGDYQYSCKSIRNSWLSCLGFAQDVHRLWYTPYGSNPGNEGYGGTVHLSLEDAQHLGLPIYAYGTKSRYYKTVPRRRPYDHAAGLALVLSRMKPITSDDLEKTHDSIMPSTMDGMLDIRGQGRICVRETRVQRSFSSNIWL